MSIQGLILKSNDFVVKNDNVYINVNKTKSVPGMLLIFAEWCKHCHHFIPTFNEISSSIGNSYCCASIESEELKGQDKLVSTLNFKGYPTICFFNQEGMIVSQYEGSRDKKSILDEICNSYHHCIENYK